MTDALMQTYRRLPVSFERGEGAWLYDTDGKAYLDALSGIAVCNLGHAHPDVAAAVKNQADKLFHTSNLYRIPLQEQVGQMLVEQSGMEHVFFCNSGAEANEAAIKVARAYGVKRGIQRPTIIMFEGSFHGRTMAALSATGNAKVREGFGPLLDGFVQVPYDNLAAVEEVAKSNASVCAVLVEPVLGEGGVVIPSDGFLRGLQAICAKHEWLFMLDEIQTGMGRTGKLFAHQHDGLAPDVMTLAKGLGNGMPIGACLVARRAGAGLTPGTHGSTFGGNPMACAAAKAVLEVIARDHICERAAAGGARLVQGLERELSGLNCVKTVRGKGMMVAVELDRPCAELVAKAVERGMLINVTADRVVRLLPPLIMSDEDIDRLAKSVATLIRDWNASA